jgi:hypothetical protein
MRAHKLWLEKLGSMTKIGLLLMMGATMSACASTSWKEEVLLHDGSKIIVERSQTYGGRHEIGQPSPIKEHTITFAMPRTNKTITWVSEYGEDLGRTNFNLLAVHILNDTPYLVASPNLCLSYNKWGRPNPPYVFFKYDGSAWQRIQLSEFPIEFKTINVMISTYGYGDADRAVTSGFISAESVKKLNSDAKQEEFKAIVRTSIKHEGPEGCPEMIYYKGGWISPEGSFGRKFMDSISK